MLQYIFPSLDMSTLNQSEMRDMSYFLLEQIPEEDLIELSALYPSSTSVGDLSHFLNRTLSVGIHMEEESEGNMNSRDSHSPW